MSSKQIIKSKTIVPTQHELGTVRLPKPSAQFRGTPCAPRTMAATKGQHTADVLQMVIRQMLRPEAGNESLSDNISLISQTVSGEVSTSVHERRGCMG